MKRYLPTAKLALAAAALVLSFASIGCGDSTSPGGDDDTSECDVTPGAWSSTGFDTNASEALELRAAIATLAGTMMDTAEQTAWGNTPATPPTLDELVAAYEAGDPSLADITPAPLDTLVRQMLADWVEAIAQDPAAYEFINEAGLEWVATGAGGMHERPPATDGTRRFRAYSASGVELRQVVDKGLFVGAMYAFALGLTEGTITPATIHAIAAAWGANPQLDATPAEGEPANDDSANYANTMGLYDETAAALTAAQAYAASDRCTAERDAALVEVFRYWEEAMFARGTYYAGTPWRESLDPTMPETLLNPLHGASEGYGLMLGMRGMSEVPSGPLAGVARVTTDADIDGALEALGLHMDDMSAGTTGEWLVEAPSSYDDGFTGDFKDAMQSLFGWNEDKFTEYATMPVASE